MSEFKVKSTEVCLEIREAKDIGQEMSPNRWRTINPRSATVRLYPDGYHMVTISGPQRLKDGSYSQFREVCWTIGGLRDESRSAPPLVFELIEAAKWLEVDVADFAKVSDE